MFHFKDLKCQQRQSGTDDHGASLRPVIPKLGTWWNGWERLKMAGTCIVFLHCKGGFVQRGIDVLPCKSTELKCSLSCKYLGSCDAAQRSLTYRAEDKQHREWNLQACFLNKVPEQWTRCASSFKSSTLPHRQTIPSDVPKSLCFYFLDEKRWFSGYSGTNDWLGKPHLGHL